MGEQKPDFGAIAELKAEIAGQQLEYLEKCGWGEHDSMIYVWIFSTSYPNLTDDQRQQAEALENKYGVGPDFAILKKTAS